VLSVVHLSKRNVILRGVIMRYCIGPIRLMMIGVRCGQLAGMGIVLKSDVLK